MRPLTRWCIRAPRLPERLTENAPPDEAFHLPGADALSAFADLLGAPPEGGADDAVRALLAGALHYQPDYVCGHHKDEPPRVCGSHTCSAACYHETSEERSE